MHDFMHIQRFLCRINLCLICNLCGVFQRKKKSHIVHGHMGYQYLYIWWARRDSNPGPTD